MCLLVAYKAFSAEHPEPPVFVEYDHLRKRAKVSGLRL
jgi:hypothetical protein